MLRNCREAFEKAQKIVPIMQNFGAHQEVRPFKGKVPTLVHKEIFRIKEATRRGEDKDPSSVYFAKELWRRFIAQDQISPQFLGTLILKLRLADMRSAVYEGVFKVLNDADGETFRNVLAASEKIILWSQGDVEDTGHQIVSIKESGIIEDVEKLCGDNKELHAKLGYLVSENKVKALMEYLKSLDKKKHPQKIVVIDDDVEVIGQACECAKKICGRKTQVVPIRTCYSRIGQTRRKTDELNFDVLRQGYNGIGCFSELLTPKFLEILKDAMILCDFDGTITDNVKSRDMQAQIIYSVLREFGAVFQH